MSDCIEWTGAKTPAGYGMRWVNGRSLYVHRIAYCKEHGIDIDEIEGKLVRHTCDNPPCHNPQHLLLGTRSDNMQDRKRPGKKYTKLTIEEAREIREQPTTPRAELAERYGVSVATIKDIRIGSTWAEEAGKDKQMGCKL